MKKIIIAGHGGVAKGILDGVRTVTGSTHDISAFELTSTKSPEQFMQEIQSVINTNDQNIYIFVDLLGATPFRIAVELSQKLTNHNFYIFTGVNLPMILEFLYFPKEINSIMDEKELCETTKKSITSYNQISK